MADAHQIAVNAALKTNNELARLFAKLGTEEAPRGRVLTAYRVARRALRGELDNAAAVMETLGELRETVVDAVRQTLVEAANLGAEQAQRELSAYSLGEVSTAASVLALMDGAAGAIESALTHQLDGIRALTLSGAADDSLILGDEERVGMLSPGTIIGEATKWIAMLALTAYTTGVSQKAEPGEFRRQAIAAIDERTTETCLRVHGQVVGLNEDFRLTGTPRFADRLRHPPFHWYCRTSVALVRVKDTDDSLTREMRDAARAELKAREVTGKRVEIHPAHARSRRGG